MPTILPYRPCRFKCALRVLVLITLTLNTAKAQLPFKPQFIQFVEGTKKMHCSIDQVTNNTFFTVSDPAQGNHEYVYKVSPEGRALTLSPELLGESTGNNRIEKLIVHNDSLFGLGLHQMPGAPPSLWSQIYTATDTLRYPDIDPSFSIPYDMHLDGDRLFACGQLDDTTYLLASDLNGQLLWDTIMLSNYSLSSITTINDTVHAFRHPGLFKFNAVTGHFINYTVVGGEGVGDCVSKDGAIYWASSSGSSLFWAKHIPGGNDVWWDSTAMNGNFITKAVDIDNFGRFWIAGNDDDGGHLIVFDTVGVPTDHVLGSFIADISIANGRIAICGGMGSTSSSMADLKYLLVGILEE